MVSAMNSNAVEYRAGDWEVYRVCVFCEIVNQVQILRHFLGGPMFKTLPSNAGGDGSIPDQRAEIPHALWPKNQNIKQKQYCDTFNKDFENGPRQEKKPFLKNPNSGP